MKKTTTILITILVLALIILTAFWFSKRVKTDAPGTAPVAKEIVITGETITEENFSGTRPRISGNSSVVLAANAYLDDEIGIFKTDADREVPGLRQEFGVDAPPAHYTIDFTASVVEGQNTESIVLDGYRYMGGANGSSFYKVFTMNKQNGALLSLANVVPDAQQAGFTDYVKKSIIARQEGIFTENVSALTFDSFKNFAFDQENLIIYFDKYEIGAGALGAVAFPLPLVSLQNYLAV